MSDRAYHKHFSIQKTTQESQTETANPINQERARNMIWEEDPVSPTWTDRRDQTKTRREEAWNTQPLTNAEYEEDELNYLIEQEKMETDSADVDRTLTIAILRVVAAFPSTT